MMPEGTREMRSDLTIGKSRIRLIQGDITMLDLDAFVFYARRDLVLGSGFGTAIAVRGGPAVQEELRALGTIDAGEAVVTTAGNLAARHIVHVVGPRFQEPDLEAKLEAAVRRALQVAEARGIRTLAFPAMGAGFYGVPLDLSARVALAVARAYLAAGSRVEEVVFCLLDRREYDAHATALGALAGSPDGAGPSVAGRGAA